MHVTGQLASISESKGARNVGAILEDHPVRWDGTEVVASRNCQIFEVQNTIVTSCFIPVNPSLGEIYLDQTYAHIAEFFSLRPSIDGSSFTLMTHPEFVPGRFILIGGPIDLNWYHWIYNWSARLVLTKLLAPTIFCDPSVKFVVDLAVKADGFNFEGIIEVLGIQSERLYFMDTSEDKIFETLYIPTFLDQRYYFPNFLSAYRKLAQRWAICHEATATPSRIWISRENLRRPSRMAANFSAIQEILARHRVESIILDSLSFRNQVIYFYNTNLVVGLHGAGLANLVFCKEGTQIIILDNERNINSGLTRMFTVLCEILNLPYRVIACEEEVRSDVDYTVFANLHRRDFLVDPRTLDLALAEISAH